MDIREILELVFTIGAVTGTALLFYWYFKKPGVKEWVDGFFSKIPVATLLRFAASKVEDKKGEFDLHDMLKVSERLTVFLRETINDPLNTSFEDVEEETFAFLSTELSRYKNAGVRGVPDISDAVLRVNVKVVFEQIVRVMHENSE